MVNRELEEMKSLAECAICLDLYTDARILTCTHSFCLNCLIEYQQSSSPKPCPTCRQNTVPEVENLRGLEPNKPLNGLIRFLIREGHVQVGETATHDDLSVAAEARQPIHQYVQCDNCNTFNIEGVRYKCYICDNYDLCENCERLPREDVHDEQHLFIKLRRPQQAAAAKAGFLSKVSALCYGYYMQQQNFNHRGTKCSNCHTSPIIGRRFKCGMCWKYDLCESCEEEAEQIHDRDHVFIALPFYSWIRVGLFRKLLR